MVLKDDSTAIERGSIVGLVGECGSGKTTLARAVLQLARALRGEIVFTPRDGAPIHPRALPTRGLVTFWRQAQMAFQNPYASFNP